MLQKPPAPVLLWWYDDVFPHNIDEGKTQSIICPNGKTCLSSCDRNLKSEPTTSAFIFYGTAFSANDLPLPRTPSHIWALMHEESPKNNWLFSHEDGIRYKRKEKILHLSLNCNQSSMLSLKISTELKVPCEYPDDYVISKKFSN